MHGLLADCELVSPTLRLLFDRACSYAALTMRGNRLGDKPRVGKGGLPERAVLDLLLPVEGFVSRRERLEIAATMEHVDPVDVVARHLQLGQIDVIDLSGFGRTKAGGGHGRILGD